MVALVGAQYLRSACGLGIIEDRGRKFEGAQQSLLDQIQGFYDVGSRAITDLYNQDALTKAAQVSVVACQKYDAE